MPVQTAYVTCAYSAWTQICEYRESRQALMVQLIDGAAVLGFSTNAPNVTTQYGIIPAGIWHSEAYGTGPAMFQVYRELDGDMVKQAWFAWLIPIGAGSTQIVAAGTGTFTVPADVTSVTLECCGAGGGGGTSGASSLGGGGGGGGVYAQTVLTVAPGDTLTYEVGAGGAIATIGNASWISNTGVAPTNTSEGCLGQPGTGATGFQDSNPGSGGNTVTSIGTTKSVGGAGGGGATSANPPGNGGGSGGGGFDVSLTTQVVSTPGATGANGNIAPTAGGTFGGGAGGDQRSAVNCDGVAGVNGAGGGGGGCHFSGPTIHGLGGVGGDGWIKITYQAGVLPTPIMTVCESFDEIVDDRISWLTVPLPRLGPKAQAALDDLLRKAGLTPHATPNDAERDQPSPDDDGA